jgi:NAD(P)-dependent dehydrogenase (short-subunit alcohol dehydrogenase family)
MPEDFLAGKAALVTGGSRNLGAAISLALAERGADVAVNYRSGRTEAEALVARMAEHGGAHAAVAGDCSTPSGAATLVADARAALGGRPVQVLVDNYGPFSMTPFAEMPDEEFRRIWEATIAAAHAAVRAVVPGMRKAGWGRIVNVSAGSAYLRNHSIYSLAKAALVTFTEALAVELGPEITVNCVTPGQIAESAEDIAEFDPSFVDRAIAATPIGRLVTRAEVAAIVAELCGPLFDGVSGATIPIDGGWHLPRF